MTARRVLFGWEYGEGLGHTSRLVEMARALAKTGWEPVFAVRDLHALSLAGESFLAVQAPQYPQSIVAPGTFRACSYADILAGSGFGSVETLLPVVSAWQVLLDLLRPDLIVADYSPILSLAAYGSVPVVAVGDGFVLPPAGADYFPRLRSGDTGLPDELAMMAVVAEVQRRRGRAVPPSLPKLSGGTRQILTVVEELDIYQQWRQEEARAPFSDPPVPLGEPSNPFPSAFVYLSARSAETRKVFQVMLDLGIVAETFVRDADARLNESLRRGGIAIHETPPSMQSMLQRHHFVIHHGGIGTAQTALALGRPQLLVPRHFEQTLTAHRLVQFGVAAAIPQRARMAEIRAAINGIMRSPELPRRSRATSEEIAGRTYRPLLNLLTDEATRALSRAHAHL